MQVGPCGEGNEDMGRSEVNWFYIGRTMMVLGGGRGRRKKMVSVQGSRMDPVVRVFHNFIHK